MTAFDQFPALVCKNCSRPIPLPPAKRPDISDGQGLWPEGGSRRNFLCPVCRHVHGYAAPDIQLMLPHTEVERIREDLLRLQRDLEKLEIVEKQEG